jgi:hypothetical protein
MVRLQPCPKDGYAWSAAEGFDHLLATNLSSGSVGVYDNIIASLGRSLEAVDPRSLVPDGQDSGSDQATKALPSPVSINRLAVADCCGGLLTAM